MVTIVMEDKLFILGGYFKLIGDIQFQGGGSTSAHVVRLLAVITHILFVTAHTRVWLDSHRGGRLGLKGHVHNRPYKPGSLEQWLGGANSQYGE